MFHPWCRCTFEIVVEDWDKWIENYTKTHTRQQAEKVLNNFYEGAIIGTTSYNIDDIHRAISSPKANFVTTDLNNPGHLFGVAVENVKPEKGYYDVKAHGDYDGIYIFETAVDANELARILLARKDYNGQSIRLLSCNTGKMVNDTCFAQELSNALMVNVKAPNKMIIVDDDGKLYVYESLLLKEKGEFIEFKPKKI